MQIKTVMRSPVVTIEEDAPLPRASELMEREEIRHLPAVRGAAPVGILTDGDVRRAEPSTVPSLARYEWRMLLDRVEVRKIMTRQVMTITPDATVREAARLMQEKQIGCLPVMEGEELVGIVTVRDLLSILIRVLEHRRLVGFGHILVATDFGGPGAQAVSAAVALARRNRARLTLLHVLSPLSPRIVAEASREILARVAENRKQDALEQLSTLVPECDGAQAVYQVAVGDPAAEIVKAAEQIDTDLIVMGIRDRSSLGGFLRGSVTEDVIRRAPCPVLVVRDHKRGRDARG